MRVSLSEPAFRSHIFKEEAVPFSESDGCNGHSQVIGKFEDSLAPSPKAPGKVRLPASLIRAATEEAPPDPGMASPGSVAASVASAITATTDRGSRTEALTPAAAQARVDGIQQAFYEMESRRMRRVLNGRFHRGGLVKYSADLLQMIVLGAILVHFVQVDWHKIIKYRQVPGTVTGIMLLAKIIETSKRPEHVFTEWMRLEIQLFVMWMAWEYNRDEHYKRACWWTSNPPCFLESEQVVMWVFGTILGVTTIPMCCRYYFIPFAVRRAFWGRGSNMWWRIKPYTKKDEFSGIIEQLFSVPAGGPMQSVSSDDISNAVKTMKGGYKRSKALVFSYRPSGWLAFRRAKFGYVGEKDSSGNPHGIGMWFDNTFHGECLRGKWVEGKPSGTFISREYGTGAQFCQRPVAYATSRGDCQPFHLSQAWKIPGKAEKIRYGVVQVEVSLAGGFFPFLPDCQHESVCDGIEEVKREFDIPLCSTRKVEALVPRLNVSVLDSKGFKDVTEFEADDDDPAETFQQVHIPIWFREGERTAYLNASELTGPIRGLVEQPKEALVFLHGYNSDLATCVGRMAQLFALGSMASHVVPFVFSYSAGFALSYLQVKKHMPVYGEDLAEFFTELGKHFPEIHILCHSCGAQFFFGNAEKFMDCFASARKVVAQGSSGAAKAQSPRDLMVDRPSNGSSDSGRKPHLATLTMVNPDVLVDVVSEKLPMVMQYAEHFTTYNDQKDGALFWSRFVATVLPKCVMRGIDLPTKGRQAVVFGSVVSPIWLATGDDGQTLLRGPIVELPGAKRSFGVSETAAIRRLTSDGIKQEDRIDVIDMSSIDQNIHKLRHNYYMLNTQVVEDICDLVGTRAKAIQRARLVRVEANVFNFLCPPADLIDL
jgi:esterase/lipase superfamily enzyme